MEAQVTGSPFVKVTQKSRIWYRNYVCRKLVISVYQFLNQVHWRQAIRLRTVASATAKHEIPCAVFQNIRPRQDMIYFRGNQLSSTTIETLTILNHFQRFRHRDKLPRLGFCPDSLATSLGLDENPSVNVTQPATAM